MATWYKKYFKLFLDCVLAFIGILLLSPLMLLISLAIKIDSKGPVLFKQPRLGLNGFVFQIFKFRSMVSDQSCFHKARKIYEDDPRITKVGRFIRKTSLDEIPQLFNIIKGEMSFIGPRPPLPYFPKKYEDYTDYEKQRFTVKPGISGLAQTRCREVHDWEVNILIDVEYVNNYSFMYDLKLFLASLCFFFKTDNIYRKR
jgi:undecaprenyl phosphate N,N'-diacetylbacillosamine 1-phosphate transferase